MAEQPHPITGEMVSWDDLIAEFAAKRRRLQDVKAEQKDLVSYIDKVQPTILEGWLKRQWTTGPKVTGIGTLFLFRQGWATVAREGEDATDAEKARAIAALDAAGLGDLATRSINTQTLSARYREWEKDGIDPPEELEGAVKFEKRSEIRVRKA